MRARDSCRGMSFFDPLPEPEPYEEVPQPEWMGPPEGVLGGLLALQAVLARTDDVLLAVSHIAVYPNGLTIEMHGLLREEAGRRRGLLSDEPDPDTALRFGVLLADGRRAASTGRSWPESDDEPGPVLMERGGGGSDRSFRRGWWLWPAPPAGPLVLVAEWPARSVPESRVTIEARALEDARSRILEVWPSGPSRTGTSGAVVLGGRVPDPPAGSSPP